MSAVTQSDFPPSRSDLARLTRGQYLVYIGTEDEMGFDFNARSEGICNHVKSSLPQGLATREEIAAFTPDQVLMHDILWNEPTKSIVEPLAPKNY